MFRQLLLLLLIGNILACSNTSKTPEVPGTDYPALPEATLQLLQANADFIDMTFYNYPISTNQSDMSSVRPSLTYWDPEPARIPTACKPAGHIWFQSKGNNLAEADFYFSPDCYYYVFYENGKPAFANPMNARGVAFFERILKPFMK